jgi:DNA repair exonuclease SbcCD ATPase subunit
MNKMNKQDLIESHFEKMKRLPKNEREALEAQYYFDEHKHCPICGRPYYDESDESYYHIHHPIICSKK